MSGFKRFKEQPAPQIEDQRDPLACASHGCPLYGTVSLASSGRYTCSCHAWADPKAWGSITHRLVEHKWLIELAADVRNAGRDQEWIPLATQFWQDEDPYMLPTASEQQRKGNYVWRLWAELEYRVGARNKRPQPIEPKELTIRGGNLGALLSQRRAA